MRKRAASARAPEEIPLARVPSLPTSPPDPRRARQIKRAQSRYTYRAEAENLLHAEAENLLHPIATAARYPFFAETNFTPDYLARIGPRWVWAMGRRGLELARFACQWASFRYDKMRAYRQLLPRSLPFFPEDADSDDAFAWWRIAGANPLSLAQERSLESLSRRIPLDLPRCEAQLARKLGRPVDLAEEAQRGRLFSVDFRRIQQSLRPGRHHRVPELPEPPDLLRDSRWRAKYLPAPIGVFVEEPGRRVGLVPVAIQIDQNLYRPEKNPVYTPDDGWGWRIAKLYFEVADVSFQLSCGHLRRTHFLIEPFALATPRQLAREHPIHILLRQHLRFTLPVNKAAYDYFRKRRKLYFDVHAGTLEEMREIAIQSYLEEELPDLELEAELASRGVERSPELYPYRDDARLWLEPIREFVQSYVLAFYASDQAVQNDGELQAWANELMNPPRQTALRPRKLVAGDSLHTREELVGLLAQVLFVAGPGHASQQYSANHFYRYPPAFPGSAYLPPPWKEDSLNEARFQNTLPPIRTAARQWTYNTFTNFRMRRFGNYGFHRLARLPEARQPILRLQEKLLEVENEIARCNQARPYRYDFLLPSQVPNSIHI
jgi:arachidonate 15-lipoxygenase